MKTKKKFSRVYKPCKRCPWATRMSDKLIYCMFPTCIRTSTRHYWPGVGAVTFNIKNDASGGTSFRKMHPPEMVVIK